MNLRTFRYLIAIADCLNFSRAADRCAVSQSTLSIQLRKLEDYLGVTLFERDHTRVVTTPVGAEVLQLARVIVRAADEIVALSRHHQMRLALREAATPGTVAGVIDTINNGRSPDH